MQLHTRLASILALATTLISGCELAEMFSDLDHPRTLVNVSITHHATAQQGAFPDRGGEGETRSFATDDGWNIVLVRAYFTTANVVLHACDGAKVPLDMYWGPLAEDITGRDLDMLTVGGVEVDATEFCTMDVHYGPYPDTSNFAGLDPQMAGATFYLEGTASKGDQMVPFEIRSDRSFDASLDMSTIANGEPLTIHGGEDYPVELALSKTYDRIFDGIDFATVSSDDLVAQVGAVLTLESRVGLDQVAP